MIIRMTTESHLKKRGLKKARLAYVAATDLIGTRGPKSNRLGGRWIRRGRRSSPGGSLRSLAERARRLNPLCWGHGA